MSIIRNYTLDLLTLECILLFSRRIPIISHVTRNVKVLDRNRRQVDAAADPFSDDFFSSLDEPAENATVTALQTPAREFNPSVDLFTGLYCNIINSFPLGCYQQNMLEIWDFDAATIQNLTVEDILEAVNTVHLSATTGHQMNFSLLLGDIKRNEAGDIISAGSLLTQWYVHVNFSEVDQERHGNIAGTENWVSEDEWRKG